MAFSNVGQIDSKRASSGVLGAPTTVGAKEHQTKPCPLKTLRASASSPWWGNELLKGENANAGTFCLSFPVEEPFTPN